MKILIIVLTILFFTVSAFGALPIKSIIMTTTMTLEQACRTYQEMWDNLTVENCGNLNKGQLNFKAGDTLKVFELVGLDANGKEILLPEVDSGVMQISGTITDCQVAADQLQISLRIFKLANPLINCN